MAAENPEFDALWDSAIAVRDNQFILTCGEKRLRQWEKLLRLRPDRAAQSSDFRKAVVILRLSSRPPLTHRWLEARTEEAAGADNYEIIPEYNAYALTVVIFEDPKGIVFEYAAYLRHMIPANLGLNLERGFKHEFFAAAATRATWEIRRDMSGELEMSHRRAAYVSAVKRQSWQINVNFTL
jgi:hypothetical protein